MTEDLRSPKRRMMELSARSIWPHLDPPCNLIDQPPELHQGLHFHGLLHTATAFIHGHADHSNAIIDSSLPSDLSPLNAPGASSSARSTPQSAKRRSVIPSQTYQFALGFPQTPPENSPELDPVARRLELPARTTASPRAMGSFLFTWYVRRLTELSSSRFITSICMLRGGHLSTHVQPIPLRAS